MSLPDPEVLVAHSAVQGTMAAKSPAPQSSVCTTSECIVTDSSGRDVTSALPVLVTQLCWREERSVRRRRVLCKGNSAADMSGRRALPHRGDNKLAEMTGQEITPKNDKTTDGVPAHSSREHDVPSTPTKSGPKKRHSMDHNHHLEGSAGKKACISSENSCVRRHLIVLLSHLKVKPENLERSVANSDQKSSTDEGKARGKTPLHVSSTHNILNSSNLQEDTTENKSNLPAGMSSVNKRLAVNLVRLGEESGNLEEKPFKDKSNHENDMDKETGSSISATSTQSSSSKKASGRSLRKKNLQSDTLEEETELSLETDSTANLRANFNVNPKVVEEEQSTEESDSEEQSDQEHMELSAYERERLKNIKANAKFLKSIKLLESAVNLHPPKKKNQSRVVKREKPQSTGNTVVRRSMRLQNVAPSQVKIEEQTPAVEEDVQRMKPPGPIDMIPVNQQDDDKEMDQFLRIWTSISQETVKTPTNMHMKALKSYENSLKKMTLRAEDVAKVVLGRILSVAIHPSEIRTLVASGDKYGNIGLWNLEKNSAEKEIYIFELHSRHVSSLSFCPWNPAHLLSLSYDGTVRCGDVTRSVFDEIYRDEEENFSSFDFYSADGSVLIVSHWDSKLSLVDRRTPGRSYEMRAQLDLSGPRSVNVHPLHRELCVVAGAGDVCVYDIRQLSHRKSRPVVSLPGHTRTVQSAYFSPVMGNRILTTCADDRLRVFDSSSLGSTVPLLSSIRHNNFTGRWLSRFQAVWDPKQEDCFVIGSMERPRQIQVFHEDGNLVHVLWDAENLNSVCSINAIHPTRNIVVGGNSSGRLHVFRNKSR